MRGMSAAFTTDFLISFAVVVMFLILIGLIMNLYSELSTLKKRYKKMMTGAEGLSIEQMLADVNDTIGKYKKFNSKLDTLEELMRNSLARVAVIHFDAFEKTGQGLSWCVAILDRNNNGVVFSSICGQETERSYVKPIEGGRTTENYKLTKEEEQALRQAMNR